MSYETKAVEKYGAWMTENLSKYEACGRNKGLDAIAKCMHGLRRGANVASVIDAYTKAIAAAGSE
jgi:hypothetical protein|tara:strand:+ start:1127 stop:1321 length:195 start_codon:yes stop_codon:yes gene_type:complete